jgi:hypothetical protein
MVSCKFDAFWKQIIRGCKDEKVVLALPGGETEATNLQQETGFNVGDENPK